MCQRIKLDFPSLLTAGNSATGLDEWERAWEGGVWRWGELLSMSRLHAQGSSLSRASTLFKAHGISDPQFPSAQNSAHDSIITFPTGLIGNQVKSQALEIVMNANMRFMIKNMIMIRLEKGQRQVRYTSSSLSLICSLTSFNNHVYLCYLLLFVSYW